jgi:hypothetical protein
MATPARIPELDLNRHLPTFLRLRDIVGRLGVLRATVYKWVDGGDSPNLLAWVVELWRGGGSIWRLGKKTPPIIENIHRLRSAASIEKPS